MKKSKLAIIILIFVLLFGCAGTTVTPEQQSAIVSTADMATDVAFYLILNNNPKYKSSVIMSLAAIKNAVSSTEDMSYDDLMLFISGEFGGEYAPIGIILSSYIATETPYFKTYLSMFDGYRDNVIKKIDRLSLLASTIKDK